MTIRLSHLIRPVEKSGKIAAARQFAWARDGSGTPVPNLQQLLNTSNQRPIPANIQAQQWSYCGRIPDASSLSRLIIDEYILSTLNNLLYKTRFAVVIVHHRLMPAGNSRLNHRIIALQHRNLLANRRIRP
jgi:hypothetical protein